MTLYGIQNNEARYGKQRVFVVDSLTEVYIRITVSVSTYLPHLRSMLLLVLIKDTPAVYIRALVAATSIVVRCVGLYTREMRRTETKKSCIGPLRW